jgi:hypothetical protein
METWPAVFTRTGLVAWLNRYERSLPRRFRADGVMTVSAPLAERFMATGYPKERIRVIQYGTIRTCSVPRTDRTSGRKEPDRRLPRS